MTSLKKSIIHGTLWSTGGHLISLLILFFTNIMLTRVLLPTDFGQVGIIMFFITIASVLTEGGLGGALVRKKKIEKQDYSTVFIFNLIISIICFLVLFISSGYIANFYNDYKLKELLIVSGIVLILNAFQITQNAKLVSEMRFKKRSIYRLISVVIGSIVGLLCAYNGCGVWSLVYMQLTISGTLTLVYWIYEGLFFSVSFNRNSFKELFGFGVNTTFASLLNTSFDNIYQLILGRYFSLNQVGFYYQAKKLQDVPGGVINMISQGVVFSSLAKLQDDKKKFYETYNKIILIFLILLGLVSSFIYIYAEQIILLLYGDKWVGAIYYMQLLTIASFFYYQEQINRVIFKVFDKTKQILYLEFLKKGIQCISIIIGIIFLNIDILIIGFVVTSIIGYFISYYYSRKVVNVTDRYEVITQLKVVLISLICTVSLVHLNQSFVGYNRLLTIPLLILIYGLLLKIFNVFNVFNIRDYIKTIR